MVTQPSPAPGPSASPVKVKGLTIPTTMPADTGSGGGGLYGLSSAGQAYLFDTTGIGAAFPGTNGQISGKDLIDAFLAMGNGISDPSDPRLTVVAAIQHALYAAGSYYPKEFTPTLGVVTTQDVKALGQALENLYNANQQGGMSPDSKPMNVTQFLTSQSAMGLNGGPLAAQSAGTRVNIRPPNPENVAAIFRQVATKEEGHKPSAAETQAFVQLYIQQHVNSDRANATAYYQTQLQNAQDRANGAPLSYDNPGAGNLNPNVNQAGTGEASGNMNPAVQGGGPAPWDTKPPPASLDETQQSLQDIINNRARAAGQSDPNAPGGLIMAGTAEPEDVSVAADNFVRNANPKATAATDMNSTFQNFLQLISGKM